MKRATIRDLRYDFPNVEALLRNGDEVELTRHGKPIARIVPIPAPPDRKVAKPDVLARLKKTWGKRVFSADEVAEMRHAELEA